MKVNRRSVITYAGALSATLLAPNLPMWARAEDAPSGTAPIDFVNVSSALLNIAPDVLSPTLEQDEIPLADVYYEALFLGAPSTIPEMFRNYQVFVNAGFTPQQIGNAMLVANASARTDPVGVSSRLTMLMWLFGVWYGGTETSFLAQQKAGNPINTEYQVDFIVSSRAYKNGWVWRIGQAHPMGFSHFRLGSWSQEPPALSQYINPLG